MIDLTNLKSLLLQSRITEDDKALFHQTPYYRSVEGQLSHTFSELQDQWIDRVIGSRIDILESSDHVVYYKSDLSDKQSRFGKIVYQDRLIHYLYESIESTKETRYFCHIAYDGTNFEGYQKQPNKRTVQGVIEEALKKVFHQEIFLYASGRTDKGVHAYDQTCHFDVDTVIPIERIAMIIRSYLPNDIEIKSLEEKPRIFHSRYDTFSKTYMYHMDYGRYDVTKRNYRWYVAPFNIDTFKDALNSVVGDHDFCSFTTTTNKNTVRTIQRVTFEEHGTELKIYIKGTGFLRYMARNLIMAAYLIASKELAMTMTELIAMKDNTILNRKAAPGGLYLYQVEYK